MKDTVTLKELAAILVRRGKLLVIYAVVFALLLGGFQATRLMKEANDPNNTPEKIEERHQLAMEEYQKTRGGLEEQLERTNAKLESQKEYLEDSLLMKLDPNNKATTTLIVSIADIDTGAFQQVYQIEGTPVDYVIKKLQQYYKALWAAADLQGVLQEAAEEKYLRELVWLDISDGGILEVNAYGATERESQQRVELAYQYLLGQKAVIEEGAYVHDLSVLSWSTKTEVDQALADKQFSEQDEVDIFYTEIEGIEQQIEGLVEPAKEVYSVSNSMKSVIKYAVLGSALGVVCAVVWVMLTYLFRSRMEISAHLVQALAVPMLGSFANQKGVFAKMADRILGERCWRSGEQALAYLNESIDAHLKPVDSAVALLSTVSVDKEADSIRIVKKALCDKGYTVLFADDASHNAEAVAAVRQGAQIVLLERCGASRWDDIQEIADLAKSLKKPISGFVLI